MQLRKRKLQAHKLKPSNITTSPPSSAEPKRCAWVTDALLQAYHDHEWGRFPQSDQALFETLMLEIFQGGLSWRTVLHKRAAMRKIFKEFCPHYLANCSDDTLLRFIRDPRLIRHKGKIQALRTHARLLLHHFPVQHTFSDFVRSFAPVIPNTCGCLTTALKQKGFTYVGAATVQSFLEAIGLVNGHNATCLWHNKQCKAMK